MQAHKSPTTPQQQAEFNQLLTIHCSHLKPVHHHKVWLWISSDNSTRALLKNRQDVFFKLCQLITSRSPKPPLSLTSTPGVLKTVIGLVNYNVLQRKEKQQIMLQHSTTKEKLSFDALLKSFLPPSPAPASTHNKSSTRSGRPPLYPTTTSAR